jgi:hypothetical protein
VKTKRKINAKVNRDQRKEEGRERIELYVIVVHCNSDASGQIGERKRTIIEVNTVT